MSETSNEYKHLKTLLTSWNLAQLLPHFQDEGINIDEMHLMKSHHIAELLGNYKMGVRIRFEHHFEKWRRNLNKPLQHGVVANCSHTCATSAASQPQEQCQPQLQQQQSAEMKKQQTQTRATNTDIIDFLNSRANTPTPPLLRPSTSTTQATEHFKEMPKLTPQPRPIEKPRSIPITHSPKSSGLSLGDTLTPQQMSLPLFDAASLDNPPMTLIQILQTSGPKGKALLEYYREQQVLTNTHRTLLIHLIVTFFEANDYHLSLNMSHNLEWQILKLFPTEKLEDYRTEKRGRIYVKFCNMKRYKREKSTVKRRWDGISVPPQTRQLVPDMELVEATVPEDDDDFAISFDSWAEQKQLSNEVQVKTENLSEDGY